MCDVCLAGYSIKAGLCELITTVDCGDGIITGTEECDDGNTEDKDGCSSECAQETDFDCAIDLIAIPQSTCSFVGQFELTKSYIEKLPYANQVSIVYNVSNSDLSFYDDIDFTNMLQVSGNNKIAKVEKLPNGQLKVTIEYQDDIQGEDI